MYWIMHVWTLTHIIVSYNSRRYSHCVVISFEIQERKHKTFLHLISIRFIVCQIFGFRENYHLAIKSRNT